MKALEANRPMMFQTPWVVLRFLPSGVSQDPLRISANGIREIGRKGQISKGRCLRGLTFVGPENMTLTHGRNTFYTYTTLNMELYIHNQALKSDDTIQQQGDRVRSSKKSQIIIQQHKSKSKV